MTEDRAAKMIQRMMSAMMEELPGLVYDTMRGMLDPAKLMTMLQGMGVDVSRLPGMIQGQAGFDPYQVLGLDKSATDEEVKRRFNELAHKLHPDASGTPATSFVFRMVLAAYEMIKLQRGWQ